MLARRLLGVLQQYPNPEVAFFTAHVILTQNDPEDFYALTGDALTPSERQYALADDFRRSVKYEQYIGADKAQARYNKKHAVTDYLRYMGCLDAHETATNKQADTLEKASNTWQRAIVGRMDIPDAPLPSFRSPRTKLINALRATTYQEYARELRAYVQDYLGLKASGKRYWRSDFSAGLRAVVGLSMFWESTPANEATKFDKLVPWIARWVSAWLKSMPDLIFDVIGDGLDRTVDPERAQRRCAALDALAAPGGQMLAQRWIDQFVKLALHVDQYDDLHAYLNSIADWAEATRPDLMALRSPEEAYAQARAWEERVAAASNASSQAELEKQIKDAASDLRAPAFTYGKYNFYELHSERLLKDESMCQTHCVSSYWDAVSFGDVLIFSMRSTDLAKPREVDVADEATGTGRKLLRPAEPYRVATIEIVLRGQQMLEARQVLGRFNQRITDEEERKAIGHFFRYMGYKSREYATEIANAAMENARSALSKRGLSGVLFKRRRR